MQGTSKSNVIPIQRIWYSGSVPANAETRMKKFTALFWITASDVASGNFHIFNIPALNGGWDSGFFFNINGAKFQLYGFSPSGNSKELTTESTLTFCLSLQIPKYLNENFPVFSVFNEDSPR